MLCELCQSEDAHNFHHLIPQTLRTNKWFKKRYTREQMSQGIEVCMVIGFTSTNLFLESAGAKSLKISPAFSCCPMATITWSAGTT